MHLYIFLIFVPSKNITNRFFTDILQEASNPMQFSSNPSYYANQQKAVQNDNVNPLQEAARQFSLASAGKIFETTSPRPDGSI